MPPNVGACVDTLTAVLVYTTGVPRSGKSTVCEALQAGGYSSVDADDHIGAWVSRGTGETLRDPPAFDARTPEFYAQRDWRYQVGKAEHLVTPRTQYCARSRS